MGGETTKTTAQKTTSRIAPTKVTKGGKDNKKYIRDEKCSVDIKRPGRSEEGAQPVSKGPARDEKFDKGGTGRSKSSAKSASVIFFFLSCLSTYVHIF
uniref:Uncharacterized protein n=1 Tax=Panagrolaimus superbus TaxID=310955 RepID=A0A914Y4Q1_9BILA